MRLNTPRRDLLVQIGELVLVVLAAVAITLALYPPASRGPAEDPRHCYNCSLAVGEN